MTSNSFIEKENIYRDFYHGKQYPDVTEKTKTMPRPIFNMCRMTIDTKVSNITAIPTTLRFNSNNDYQTNDMCTKFVNYILKEGKWDSKRAKLVKDCGIKGTSWMHIFYNEKKVGTYGDYIGGIDFEMIDMANVVVSNPLCKDVQSQEYVIVRTKRSVRSVRKLVKDETIKKLITPDTEDGSKENEENKLCYTYLKYYRKNGEVYHSLATKNVVIYEGHPLNSDLVVLKNKPETIKYETDINSYLNGTIKREEDTEYINLPDDTLEKNSPNNYSRVRFYRYPIQPLVLIDTDDSILGESMLNDLTNTQRYINELYAVQLLNARAMAWDKIIARKDALGKQVITAEPGQVLIDYSREGNGIKRLGGMNALSNGVVDLAEKAFNFSRTVSQVNDVFTGQADQKDLSGVAIQSLQNQNDKPIDELRKVLWSFEEEIGKTLELFMKTFYKTQTFYFEQDEATIIRNKAYNSTIEKSTQPNKEMLYRPTEKFQEVQFDADLIKGLKFHVSVEAVQGTKDSEVMLMSVIQSLFLNGSWNNMDIHAKKFFVEMYPLPEKDKFKALLEAEEQDYVTQLEGQQQQMAQQIQTLLATLQKSQNAISYMGNLNKSLVSQYKNEAKAHKQDLSAMQKVVDTQEKGGLDQDPNNAIK